MSLFVPMVFALACTQRMAVCCVAWVAPAAGYAVYGVLCGVFIFPILNQMHFESLLSYQVLQLL